MLRQFVVIREHTLGCINPLQPNVAQILGASVLRGALDLDGTILVPMDAAQMRPATRADFNTFRVNGEGFRQDTENYNFPED